MAIESVLRIQRKRNEQLGMAYSTAYCKLKKSIMFMLIVKSGMDTCFKCNRKIETEKELSIEHKKDWLDINSELFWNIDNIAFSHKACNKPSRTRRIVCPSGKSWCTLCKDFYHVSMFSKNRTRYNGLSSNCKKCSAKYRSSWYLNFRKPRRQELSRLKKNGELAESGLMHRTANAACP